MNVNCKMINGDSLKMNGDFYNINGSCQENGPDEMKKSYVDAIRRGKKLIWNKKQKDIPMEKFMDTIRNKYGVTIDNYWDLHKWSIQNTSDFWEEIFKHFEIIHSEPYCQVLPPYEEIVDVDWFRGLKFNFTENMLRYRDDRVALICLDEEGREKIWTYAEVYEEVKRYATALRKHGLKTGDKVACCMSNREETLFAMLASASIGAVWGGLVPFYGTKAASAALRVMNPRFLFIVDRFSENQIEHNVLEKFETTLKGITSIEKIIILATKEETLQKDISGIRGSYFLNDFLECDTANPTNGITDLKFEQLPFNHPVSINFTSGTTGIPKGVVHSAGAILALMKDFAFHYSCTRDDVVFSMHGCGWTLWNMFTSTLSLGCTVVLYCGNPFFLPHTSVWDIMAKYKVTMTSFVTSIVDRMEKLNIVPGPSCDLSNLRMICPVGSPVKLHNFNFLKQKVKQDMFVGSLYGTTEIASCVSGFHLNSPAYSGQVQGITLGLDLRVFDHSGNSVIGQPGEVVVCSPLPNFPLYLLNDEHGERMRTTYLSKFPGVWALNDEGWIDPETNGLVIVGRSDDIFNPQEERFGPNDIYFAIQDMEEIVDSLCVRQNCSKGNHRVVLFVKLSPTSQFTEELVQKISSKIKQELTEYHIPEVILETKEIPLNANGKKMERLVSQILDSNEIPESNYSRNAHCLEFYRDIPELRGY